MRSGDLVYDDAPWLSANLPAKTSLKFVHQDVGNSAAAAIGAKSLREVLLSDQSSMQSIPCPTAESVATLLKKIRSQAWIHDILEMADDVQATKVHFMWDERDHKAESLVHPGLVDTQGPAMVVALEGAAFTTEDLVKYAAPAVHKWDLPGQHFASGFPQFGGGLSAFFKVTDCLEVLSGDQFHVFDPLGKYMFNLNQAQPQQERPSDGSRNEANIKACKSIARRYALSEEEVFHRFPDQFAPFLTLPYGVMDGLKASGRFNGTVFRLPLRKEASALSSSIFEPQDIQKCVQYLKDMRGSPFLFSLSIQVISMQSWRSDDGFPNFEFTTQVQRGAARASRHGMLANKEWRKSKLASLFKSFVPPKSTETLEVLQRCGDTSVVDTWVVHSSLAPGKTRDMAIQDSYAGLGLMPLLSVAALVHRSQNGSDHDFPRTKGMLYAGQSTSNRLGLPFHIDGPFMMNSSNRKITLASSQSRIVKKFQNRSQKMTVDAEEWNALLFKTVMSELVPGFLMELRNMLQHNDASTLYRFWPYNARVKPEFRDHVPREMYQRLTSVPIYLSLDSGFMRIDEGLFKRQRVTSRVEAFVRRFFPLFQVPHQVTEDLLEFGANVQDVTPSQIRKFLRKRPGHAQDILGVPGLVIELLEYCLSDCDVRNGQDPGTLQRYWLEMHGISLVPLADGSVGTFSRSSPFILADAEQQSLLPHLQNRFISLQAQRRLCHFFREPAFISLMGFAVFSPTVLANNIAEVLPRSWRNECFVKWDPVNDPSVPSYFWLASFWKQVSLLDLHPVDNQFRQWPLLPTTSGELLSCSSVQLAVKLCDKACDTRIESEIKVAVKEQTEIFARRQGFEVAEEKKRAFEEERQAASMGDEGFTTDFSDSDDELEMKNDDEKETKMENKGGEEETKGVEAKNDCDETDLDDVLGGEGSTPTSQDLDDPPPLPPRRPAHQLNERQLGAEDPAPAAPPAPPTEGPSSGSSVGNAAEAHARDNPRSRRLRQQLHTLGCPVLELAFFPKEQVSALVLSDDQTVTRAVLTSLYDLRSAPNPVYPLADGVGTVTENLRLRWGSLTAEDLDHMLYDLYYGAHGTPVSLAPSDLDKLKHIPLFETLSGRRAALAGNEYFSLSQSPDLEGLPLSQTAMEQFLAPKDRLQDLHRDLGVVSISHSGIIARFLLPDYQNLSPEDQQKLMTHILAKWEELKEDEQLINVIKEVPFMGVKASSLYDPRNELLKDVFGDDPLAFPQGVYASPEWLVLLADIGLKNTIDKETFLDCARKLESQRAEPLPFELNSKATRLLRYLLQHFQDFYDQRFVQDLSQICIVPVNIPIGNEPGQTMPALRRYGDAAVPKDKNLCFTVIPIIPGPLLPPQLMWSQLGIISPPKTDVVLQHLRSLTDGSSIDRWAHAEPAINVFQSLYSFLDENWEKLTPQERGELKEAPIVPVGGRLVKASRLFFRLKEDLSPYMFEVPRVFGAYDKLLQQLGTTNSPTAQDYSQFLGELKRETGDQPLNPNELNAVLKCVDLVANEFKQNGEQSLNYGIGIYIPDDHSILVARSWCLFNDSPWLRGRVNPAKLRAVHPKIHLNTCKLLQIMSVSEVVKEALEDGFEPEPFLVQDSTQQLISNTVVSQEFAVGLVILIQKSRDSQGSLFVQESLNDDGSISTQKLSSMIARRLDGFKVQYVRTVRTRFLRTLANETEEDITIQAEGSLYFVDESQRRILIAKSLLPSSVPPHYAVALALAQRLGLSDDVVAPMSAMLASSPDEIHRMLDILRLGEDSIQSEEMRRGQPGQHLIEADLALVELKPLRSFLPNEIVAWDDKGILKYGVVVQKEGDEVVSAATEGGENSSVADEVLRYIMVRQTPTRLCQMLTSEVYSFKQAKSQGANPSPPTGGISAMMMNVSGAISFSRSPKVGATGISSALDSKSAIAEGLEERKDNLSRPSHVNRSQILDAVQNMLSKVDLTLDTDQREMMEESLKLKEELRQASKDLQRGADEMAQVQDELLKMKAAFQCQICFQNDVDQILIPCGHLLCTSCKSNLRSLRPTCPFCRERFNNSCPFYKPTTG